MFVSALKKVIQTYHWLISPLLGKRCRYAPSCSEYAIQALDQHGAAKGGVLAIGRLCRCHPWGGHGYDPVPTIREMKTSNNFAIRTVKNRVETELEK